MSTTDGPPFLPPSTNSAESVVPPASKGQKPLPVGAADAIAHAVSDALLGAAGLGDIGEHFPDSYPQWKGADSMQILRQVVGKVRAAGWRVENVDVNVICEHPKIAPHRAAMQANLAAAVGAPVSVKGRRSEGLGSIGRVEGIACMAVALLVS